VSARLGLLTVIILGLFLLAAGCGYHVSGKGGGLPLGVRSLSIPVFVNQTSKPDIEATITNAFVSEFVSSVDVAEDGEAVMEGLIKSYSLGTVSYTRSDVNLEQRLTVVMSVVLRRRPGGAVLWQDEDVRDYEDFMIDSTDVNATREAELEALRKISRDTARLVKERMLDDF